MLKGYVAQGDTSNAADCRVAYNKLSAQYGAAYIQPIFPNHITRKD